VEVTPVPLRLTSRGEELDDVATEMDPLFAPDPGGLNCAVKVTDCPGVKVCGVVRPDTLKPAPEALTLLTVPLAVPPLVNWIVWLTGLPTCTFPKLIEAGVTPIEGATPVAVTLATICGARVPIVIVMLPLCSPAPVGLKVAVKFTLSPGVKFIGVAGPEMLKPVPLMAIFVSETLPTPPFVTVTVCVALAPTATFPNLTGLGETSSSPTGGVPGLLTTPTQPAVPSNAKMISSKERLRSAGAPPVLDERGNPCERASSRMGKPLMTRGIVRRSVHHELLARSTHLGQVRNPVRPDSPILFSTAEMPFGALFRPQLAG
jgi:hypothetical protein